MDENDLFVENILDTKAKKQKPDKVDGKAKGNRTELNLCKLLTDKFGQGFSKAPGSGSRIHQVFLPEFAKMAFTGDLCVPEGFRWVIECKGGYEDDIDLANALDDKPIPRLDEFIEQTSHDSNYCGRKPIVCWKRNRKPWLALMRAADLENVDLNNFPYRFYYREWIMISLAKLLEITEKSYWFNESKL